MFRFLILALLAALAPALRANNIDVANIFLGDRDLSQHSRTIRFDVGWENSWRVTTTPLNWDAAWIFVKYRIGDGAWQHATLSGTAQVPTGTTVDVTTDGVGAFVYRSAPGVGDVLHSGIEVVWDYAADGVTDDDLVTVEVFAIEMVYVPEGAYFLGANGNDIAEFYQVDGLLPLSTDPYEVDSEASIRIGTLNGDLNFLGATIVGNLPTDYPKGYRGFYCMKYETSQQQYVQFFNHQPVTRQLNLDLSVQGTLCANLAQFRQTFCWDAASQATTSYPYVPISFLSVNQMLSYLDWTGLRPMTELEYEKASRGTVYPVPGEYAWGNAAISTTAYTVSEENNPDEHVGNADDVPPSEGNGLYFGCRLRRGTDILNGPVRVGAFAASGTRFTRISSGGSYYGILELSGNLSELVVTVGDPVGRAFSGLHGDGELSEEGWGDVLDWPLGGLGYGSRGGSFLTPRSSLRVSAREFAATYFTAGEAHGFRGVRSYPN
ncbi:formylglycine-generating enzyme required for sulfatase activity [Lewinella marina]|uniref:Sulfatase-modifying factor enzyme-like domain-containing protein n=1 Tax=Neolewinella marina TaxID=438751 RepID=A0A2G0CKB4_9BACT|nr:SUMF1/EgtB/PvdO family nonheme iron enzyme [Neolewinella marina]NJB84403.1 formylglycine-generating enzyme required for sulfatase activity [Neolewinella marina]PHL00402.1 hypothetical protein CGL56_05045 [Neolewinella marina]